MSGTTVSLPMGIMWTPWQRRFPLSCRILSPVISIPFCNAFPLAAPAIASTSFSGTHRSSTCLGDLYTTVFQSGKSGKRRVFGAFLTCLTPDDQNISRRLIGFSTSSEGSVFPWPRGQSKAGMRSTAMVIPQSRYSRPPGSAPT